ncbi:hypothetical protein LRO89_08830 [Priestia megaterium]|uniref:hypothetical protein n=1 Tax=Priestia megaterium TaxID=1404 RepID=UPI0039C3F763
MLKMIILGESNKEKGTQLELFIKSILEKEKYDVQHSLKSFDEIDVYGEIIEKGEVTFLIGECKAHKGVTDMTDWEKFLGKIFIREKINKQKIRGWFIALNGVNSNVAASYEELKKIPELEIELLDNNRLVKFVKKYFPMKSSGEVQSIVRNTIHTEISSKLLAFYENNIYWILNFSNNKYTILSSNADYIKGNELNKIKNMYCESNYYSSEMKFLNLEKSKDIKPVVKTILGDIFLNGGKISINDYNKYGQIFIKTNLNESLKFLLEENWVTKDTSYISLNQDIEKIINIYKYVLSDDLPDWIFNNCSFYVEKIDNIFVKKIEEMYNIQFDDTEREYVKSLLKWSPSAVYKSLTIPYSGPKSSNAIFINALSYSFLKDYMNGIFRKYKINDQYINYVKLGLEGKILTSNEEELKLSLNEEVLLQSNLNLEIETSDGEKVDGGPINIPIFIHHKVDAPSSIITLLNNISNNYKK